MKKITTFALSLFALTTTAFSAETSDFTVLTTPEDVLKNSIETVDGAKAEFKAILDNDASTDTEKIAAMQAYMQRADPKPGYGFDMSFLLYYNAVTAENKGQYTKAKLAEYWHCDVEGVAPDASNNTLQVDSDTDNGTFMRIYSASEFKTESSFDKFIIYQNVDLEPGAYYLTIDSYTKGAVNCVTLSAGDYNSSTTVSRSPMQNINLNFKLDNSENIKLGLKRNATAGALTHVCFNNMYLYKLSDVVVIQDDATGALDAATGVDVLLNRSFQNDRYYPICLPFIVENWRDVFEDLLLWNNYADGNLAFATVSGANTQARKPYLVKFKENITEENYMMFKNVNIDKGNPGSWTKSVKEGEDPFPVKMVGNWGVGTVPANCYYLDGEDWKLSDGTAPLKAFSAYIDATGLNEHPSILTMTTGSNQSTLVETIDYNDASLIVNVYNLQGMAVKTSVELSNALDNLPTGIYIVNGKKIVKR